MTAASMITAFFQVSLFLLGPLLLPLFLKKWLWFGIVAAGYALYLALGAYLYLTEEPDEFGTLYGIMLPLFIGFFTIAGLAAQLIVSRRKNEI